MKLDPAQDGVGQHRGDGKEAGDLAVPQPACGACASDQVMDGVKPCVDPTALGVFLDEPQPNKDGHARLVDGLKREIGGRGRLLYLSIGGSHAYGTSGPTSDLDFRGTFAHGRRNLLSLDAPFEGINRSEPDDLQVDPLRKLLDLGLKGKYSVAEMLFVPADQIVYRDPLVDPIFENRQEIVSKAWFRGILGYFNKQVESLSERGTGSNLGRMRREYTCGPEGDPSEQYDGKFAMHAIRLGNVGLDLAEKGEVIVRRPEAPFLIQVRRGEAFPRRSELVAFLQELEARLVRATERSALREAPNRMFWSEIYRHVEESA